MPDDPKTANTEDLAVTEYDAEALARAGSDKAAGSNAPLPTPDDAPGVGLAQKGLGEDAVVRRETDV